MISRESVPRKLAPSARGGLYETAPPARCPGVAVSRVELSIGAVELYRFEDHRHAFPRHAHDFFTVGALGRGNGSIRVRGSAWAATEGAVLALAPDESHAAEPLRESGWSYRSLCPSREISALVLDHVDRESFTFERPVVDDPALARAIDALHCRLEGGEVTLGTEESLLVLLRRLVRRHGGRRAAPLRPPVAGAVAQARELLDAKFAESVPLAVLASACEMSPFQLIRAFRAALGVTPHAYLTQLRAERARSMLRTGESISGAAYRCGFVDQSHLTRVFKRIYGVTPGLYARSAAARPPAVARTVSAR